MRYLIINDNDGKWLNDAGERVSVIEVTPEASIATLQTVYNADSLAQVCELCGLIAYAETLPVQHDSVVNFNLAQQTLSRQVERDMHNFIDGYLPRRLQQFMQAVYTELLGKTSPLTATETQIKIKCELTQNWVHAILVYYQSIMDKIIAAEGITDLQEITYNFEARFGANGSILTFLPLSLTDVLNT